jgi:hypothetical protein
MIASRRTRIAAAVFAAAAILVAQEAPPSPAVFFGARLGADGFAPSPEGVFAYGLAAARSPRVLRREAADGVSLEGRALWWIAVSAPRHLARFDEIAAFHRRVAAGELSPAEARAADEPALVVISAGVHADEPAGIAAALENIRRLATDEDDVASRLRETTVAVFVPCMNPDGLARVRAWHERTRGGPGEGTSPPDPAGAYVGHDLNRDAWRLVWPESRYLNRLLEHELRPAVYVDQHQFAPTDARLFVGELLPPAHPGLDPSVLAGVSLLGSYVRAALTAEGRRGVLHRANWDGAWQGAHFTHAWARHVPALLTESAAARLWWPLYQRPEDLDGAYRRGAGKSGNAPDWNHPWPWTGGWWRPRDAVEYDAAAAWAALDAASLFRGRLRELRAAAARRGLASGPGASAFFLDGAEDARVRAADLRRLLTESGVRSHAATIEGRPACVVPDAQPYAALARDLLRPAVSREAPGPGFFDVSAWTAAALCGVPVARFERTPPLAPASAPAPAPAPEAEAEAEAEASRPARAEGPATPPRLGLFRSSFPCDDAGYVRAYLDGLLPGGAPRLPYVVVRDADVRRGDLGARLDVLVFASEDAREVRDGRAAGSSPPEYCGGLGAAGAAAVRAFVLGGGRLVVVDRAVDFASEIFTREELPFYDVVAGLSPERFSCPGALVSLELAPVGGGSSSAAPTTSATAVFVGSRAFEIAPSFAARAARAEIWARYAPGDPLFAGRALGLDAIAGKVAAWRLGVGRGDVVAFGFPPLYRGWTTALFPLFRRALLR